MPRAGVVSVAHAEPETFLAGSRYERGTRSLTRNKDPLLVVVFYIMLFSQCGLLPKVSLYHSTQWFLRAGLLLQTQLQRPSKA